MAQAQAKMAIITGWIYYPEFLFSKKSKFLYKSGHINRLDILSVDILSGVYCNAYTLPSDPSPSSRGHPYPITPTCSKLRLIAGRLIDPAAY